MQTINYTRTIIGGLLASAVLFAAETALILSMRSTILAAREAAHMPVFVPQPLLSLSELLITGFLLIWIYAAIRPRFGAGVLTAVRSGLVVWVCLGVIVTIHTISDNFGLPASLLLLIGAGMLPVMLLSSVAGAWAYRE